MGVRPLAGARSRSVWFTAEAIVHGDSDLPFASEIALRRLDGDVSEQELDLIQFAIREVAETGTSAPQIMRANLSIPARAAAAQTTSHSTFGDMPSPHMRPARRRMAAARLAEGRVRLLRSRPPDTLFWGASVSQDVKCFSAASASCPSRTHRRASAR